MPKHKSGNETTRGRTNRGKRSAGRNVPMNFLCSPEERARWERKASQSGMLLSHYIRHALDSAPVFKTTIEER